MPTGVGTALLISAAIGAGTSAVEAGIQSHQTSKAVGAQEKAAAQAQANLKPFQDVGTQAFQTLGGLMGLGGGGVQAQAAPSLSGPTNGVTRNSSANYPLPMGAISDPNANGGYAGQVPGTATLGSASSYANPQRPGYGPQSSPVNRATVKMQAPDGSVQDVPGDQVSHYTQLGAKVVG